jgi:hypothetical protein
VCSSTDEEAMSKPYSAWPVRSGSLEFQLLNVTSGEANTPPKAVALGKSTSPFDDLKNAQVTFGAHKKSDSFSGNWLRVTNMRMTQGSTYRIRIYEGFKRTPDTSFSTLVLESTKHELMTTYDRDRGIREGTGRGGAEK